MTGSREQSLVGQINVSLGHAQEAEQALVDAFSDTQERPNDHSAAFDEARQAFEFYLGVVFRECRLLAELLGMTSIAREIRTVHRSHVRVGLSYLTWGYSAHEHYSPALADIRSIFRSIEPLVVVKPDIGALSVFERILRNTARIISEAGKEPDREPKVRDEVLRVCRYAFGNDAQKEIPVKKRVGTYLMDIGIISLKAAAEYKFLRTAEELKTHIDQIVADVVGYGGTPDWQIFYAVLYQAEPFHTQEDVTRALADAGAKNWTAIVLNGPSAITTRKR